MAEIPDKKLMDDVLNDMLLTGTAIVHTDAEGVQTRVDPADFWKEPDVDDIKVSFEYRKRGSGDTEPAKWYAHIELANGTEHHGIGDTAPEALLNAAQHWAGYTERRAKLKGKG